MVAINTRVNRDDRTARIKKEIDDRFIKMMQINPELGQGFSVQEGTQRLETLALKLEAKVPSNWNGNLMHPHARDASKVRIFSFSLNIHKNTFDEEFGVWESEVTQLEDEAQSLTDDIDAKIILIKEFEGFIETEQDKIDNPNLEYVPKEEKVLAPDSKQEIKRLQGMKETYESELAKLNVKLDTNTDVLTRKYLELDKIMDKFKEGCALEEEKYMPTIKNIEDSYSNWEAFVDFFKWLASGWGDDAYQSTKTVTQEFKAEYENVVASPAKDASPEANPDEHDRPENKGGGGNQLQ
jgi:hypothetical protein